MQEIIHSSWGKPDSQWAYKDTEGNPLFYTCRWDTEKGKVILPASLREDQWQFKGIQGKRPLYNLDGILNSEKPVLVVEGEKSVDGATSLFPDYVSTTSSGGSSGYSKTDWSSLKGKDVVLWPDNDDAGFKYAENVAKVLYKAEVKSIRSVAIPEDFPNKWDLGDPIPEGYSFDDIETFLNEASYITEKELGVLRSLSVDTLMTLEIPPREYLLEPIIQRKSIGILYAYRGVGKTYFSLSLACAIASGTSFLKWKSPKPLKVLYIDGEMPLGLLKERLKQLSHDKTLGNNLTILASDYQEYGIPNLLSKEGQEAVQPFVDKADFVIVDNIATLCPHARPNDIESWLDAQNWALSLRRQNKAVLFIHHAGKNGGQRGTSGKEDVVDLSIELKHSADYTPEQGARFELHFMKSRGLMGDDVEPLDIHLKDDGWHYKKLENALKENTQRQSFVFE